MPDGSPSWQPLNLSAAEYERPTEPPITCGLIYRGKRHALSGPPESAKTLAALIFGLEHARAGHGPFALVDFEMGGHATRLVLEDLGATLEEIQAVYYVAPEGPPSLVDIEAIAAAGVTLTIIDAAAGAYDVSGLDDMKRKDAEAFARAWVRPLWQREIGTLLLDHVVKNSDNRGRYAIGTERKLGAVDVHLGLEAVKSLHRGADGIIRITTHKDRPAHLKRPHPAELHLASDPDTHRITWEFKAPAEHTAEGGWQPTQLMQKVSLYLESKTEPLTRTDVSKGVIGRKAFVLQAIDALITDGYITSGDGKGSKLSSVRPFRVPGSFPSVPGTAYPIVPTVPPPSGGNGNGNAQPAGTVPPEELERLLTTHADIATGAAQTSAPAPVEVAE